MLYGHGFITREYGNMTNSDFFLSIGIPTWNRYPFLKKNVDQIIAEIVSTDNHKIEIFVSDNASEDDTEHYCQALAQRYAFFHYCRQEKNKGANANFQNVIQASQGKYIWLLGDDDLIVPGSLEKIISAIETYHDPDIVIGGCLNNQTEERIYPPFISQALLTDQAIIKRFDAIKLAGKISVLIFKKAVIEPFLPLAWQIITQLNTPWPHIVWLILILNSEGHVLFLAENTNYFLEENRYNMLQDGVSRANIMILEYARLIGYLQEQALLKKDFYEVLKKSISYKRGGEFLKIVAYATYMNGYWATIASAVKIFKNLPGFFARVHFLIFYGLPVCVPLGFRKLFFQLPKIFFPKWQKYKNFITYLKEAAKRLKQKQQNARNIFDESGL